jgi:hypothetical protein
LNCDGCGAELPSDSLICPNCGAKKTMMPDDDGPSISRNRLRDIQSKYDGSYPRELDDKLNEGLGYAEEAFQLTMLYIMDYDERLLLQAKIKCLDASKVIVQFAEDLEENAPEKPYSEKLMTLLQRISNSFATSLFFQKKYRDAIKMLNTTMNEIPDRYPAIKHELAGIRKSIQDQTKARDPVVWQQLKDEGLIQN